MTIQFGIDIGGSKVAGAIFGQDGTKLAQQIEPTPASYDSFLAVCRGMVRALENETGLGGKVGVCFPGGIDYATGTAAVANIPYLNGRPVLKDLAAALEREVRFANDANCIALAEAYDGAGQGAASVLGVTLSTGVGSGLVIGGKILDGPNGLTGEIGHLPLPFREEADGPLVDCFCGQKGCIEKSLCGAALSRLYLFNGGESARPEEIAALAEKGEAKAVATLDRYYEIVAKAMITAIHSFDPDVIVVTGGLSHLPRLFEEIPKRWGRYCVVKNVKTKFVRGKHGALASLRGAALLWEGER